MFRQLVAVLIFVCLVVIAFSLSAMANFTLGLSIRESSIIGFGTLACLAAFQSYLMVSRRLEVLENELSLATGRAQQLHDELKKLAMHSDASDEGLRNQMSEQRAHFQTDVAAMTGIARKLAERTARLEARINEFEQMGVQAMAAPQQSSNAAALPALNTPQPTGRASKYLQLNDQSREEDRHFMVSLIDQSLRENSFELHLQPVMGLPARRQHSFEAMVRFKEADGTLITAAECLRFAKDAGQLGELDLKMATRVIGVASKLAQRGSTTPIFVNISGDLLSDSRYFSQFFNLMEANKDISRLIVVEVSQASYRNFSVLETESMSAIHQLGFDLSMDLVVDRNINAQSMFDQGFRHLKMPVEILTADDEIEGMDIHPQDLADFTRRRGLSLIATHVETEANVVAALEYGVKFGQGQLFAAPKPVRVDLLNEVAGASSAPISFNNLKDAG